jgi:hypothetical protein
MAADKTREQIITAMCKHYWPGFAYTIDERTTSDQYGATIEEQAEVYHKMMQVYDSVIDVFMEIKGTGRL